MLKVYGINFFHPPPKKKNTLKIMDGSLVE